MSNLEHFIGWLLQLDSQLRQAVCGEVTTAATDYHLLRISR